MATTKKTKKSFSKLSQGTQLAVTASNASVALQQTQDDSSAPSTHPAPAADPKGLKNYIAFDVAHGIYPVGDKVDPNRPIADDMSSNSDIRALQVNLYAKKDAGRFGYTWSAVKPSDLSGLKIVGDLMDLVVAHLS
jgi:hypothetical protein